ncbi:nitrate- and nitrite sensing domain-containing protein [Amycolatopsis sp. NPDC059027]|uniref:sensor histidine kinase n=1 Tax=unclassified Amycolatopsis TaxID=2618356 RepID=UPI00367107E6
MPVGKLLGRPPQRSRWASAWQALVRWRDWSLPVKLAAVTVVPIIIALVLGVTTIASQVGRSGGYQRIDRLVALGSQVRALATGLEHERTVTAATLTAGTVGGTPELTAARAEVDAAVGPYTAAAGRAAEAAPGVDGLAKAASGQLDRLASVRKQAASGQLEPLQAIAEYSTMTAALMDLDTALAAGSTDDALGGTPNALHELTVAGDQLSTSQALVSFGIARAGLAPSALDQLNTAELRLADRLAAFRAAATDAQRADFDRTVSGSAVQTRDRLAKAVRGTTGVASDQALRRMAAAEWNDSSSAMLGKLGEVAKRMGDQVGAASAELVEDSSSGAGLLAVLLFGALVLAVAVVFLITRQLLRSLKVLRRSALDVAENQLPDAVRNIQEGRAQSTEVQPVAVGADDEIGEVARAFDKVHHQALRLATEQAAMRTGYGSVFVNLSRRSQSLVQRQLQLIEQLERDEEDADQLATLFQLDHLATRMRRNNENLMVLSGAEPGRRSGRPVGTTDMLRAAVSEIEQYQRVVVQPPPSATIVGYAASDLMRLVAELLDNATAFSAPATQVTVATRLGEDGSLNIDILDKGIGMNAAEVAEANARLTEAGSVDLATSRRMGLFVVGRLASRHRIGVSLHGGKDIVGVRATVVVPAELVTVTDAGPATGPITRPPMQTTQNTQTTGGLPRRLPVNGSAVHVPAQPGENRWPSASDLAGHTNNGHTPPQVARPPSDLEISGTALFSPIPSDEPPAAPPAPLAAPPPPRQPEPEPKAAEEPAELPSGKDLFSANGTALSDWWQQAATSAPPPAPAPAPAPKRSETTPIFDEMLSAWFREPAKPAADGEQQPAAKEPETDGSEKDTEKAKGGKDSAEQDLAEQERRSWDFASDENWRTVQAVTQAQATPTSFTQAGLPRRRRGERLLPGSAVPAAPAPAEAAAEAKPELPVRDPADVRGRLSSFQQGVYRGRLEVQQAVPEAPAAAPEKPVAPQQPEQQANPAAAGQPAQAAPGTTPAGRPATPPSVLPSRRRPATPPPAAQPAAAAPAAQPPAAQTPASRTPASRTPAAQPGAEAPAVQQPVETPAAEVPQPPLVEPLEQPRPEVPATAVADRTADAAWSFGSDEGWRSAQSVSQSTPSAFTSAGLPRRRRGEQLLPGSVAPLAGGSNPRPQRDAHDVRGRLSSFQQGIQRGRHHNARAAESNHETLEGE